MKRILTIFLLGALLLWLVPSDAQLTKWTSTGSADIASMLNGNPMVSTYPYQTKTKLVFIGDSRTAGFGVDPDANWPAYLTNSFATFNVVGCTNAAVSGYTIASMATNYTTYVAPLKPAGGTNGILFVWGGINDSASTAQQIHDALSNLWVTAKGDGWQVAAMTIFPASSLSLANNQKMEQANNLIRQSLVWDYLVDVASLITTDYGTTTDGIHATTNYHGLIARQAFKVLSSQSPRNSDAPQSANGNGFLVTTNGNVTFYAPIDASTFTGNTALTSVTNTTFGVSTLPATTASLFNTAFGYNTLHNTTGADNTAVGYNTMSANTSGQFNTAMGFNALSANTNSSYTISIGYRSLIGLKNGDYNIGIGGSSLEGVVTGTGNVAAGYGTGFTLTGSENVAIGHTAMFLATSASDNTAVGAYAGRYQNDGSTALATPANSVYIGWKAMGKDNSDNNSIVIGASAIGLGANTAVLGNTSITDTYLRGSVHISGATNQVIFGATNSAPSSSVSPTKWVSVQITGETNIYRLPLYE